MNSYFFCSDDYVRNEDNNKPPLKMLRSYTRDHEINISQLSHVECHSVKFISCLVFWTNSFSLVL